MKKVSILGLGLMAVLVSALAYDQAAAQLYQGGKGESLKVTEAELEECKKLGIPEFECNQQTVLAARSKIYAQNPNKGSGTSMLAGGLGEAAAFMAALIGIFGAISAAFFAMSRTKKPQ
ncbi:MAG: hypothetical protein QW416_05745 [Candidatus Nitrosocaldaceae archaeon]